MGARPTPDRPVRHVEIVEVGPRDGLQNEALALSTQNKIAFVERAIAGGSRRIEIASFVRADCVPQMADAEAVIAGVPVRDDVIYIGLVLNERGVDRALATTIDEIGAVCVASDSFARRNQGQTSAESLDIACSVAERAIAAGRRAQITISAAFGCPFEGEIAADHVVRMAERAAQAGVIEVALADTIGVAVPPDVEALVARVGVVIAPVPVRVHFHNTRNTGIANVWAAVQAGATVVDGSLAGLGGCPFAPRATGNAPTEDIVYMLERAGIATGHDLPTMIATAGWLRELLGRDLPGMVSRSGPFPKAA